MKVQLTVAGGTLTATLVNGAAAREFASLLPMKLTLRDYAGRH